jgi:flagellar biosynthesis anti-sigma factor FlgM
MVGIQGLGGVPEPKSGGAGKVRDDRETSTKKSADVKIGAGKDDVSISSEARQAAEINRITQLTKSQDDIRAEKVARAKERIAEGNYRTRESVEKVAQEILKLIG